MKIVVVDLISIDGGGYRVTSSFYNYIKGGKCQQHEWLFIVSEQDFVSNQYVTVKQIHKGLKGYCDRAITELFSVNKIIKEYGAQLVIAMSNMCILGCHIQQLVYLQQSIPFQTEKRFSFLIPEERKYAFRQYCQGEIIKKSLRKAAGILVQTKWMETAVGNIINSTPIIRIGYPEEGIKRTQDKAKVIHPDFFYPCGPELYKNLKTIDRAVKRLKEKGYEFNFYLTITKEEFVALTGKELDSKIYICMGRITPEEVQKMYAKTTLVFASYIETVGLPLVEAKNAGTWIIASDCAFSHEILDSYPNKCFFSYKNDMELSKEMEDVLQYRVLLQTYQSENRDNNCWQMLTKYIDKEMKQ